MKRFWELDFARGFAVVLMLVFNWLFTLGFFGLIAFDSASGFWWWFARFVMFLFVFVSGASIWISYSRAQQKLKGPGLFDKYLRRGAFLFSAGLLITIATWFFTPDVFVVFGVLHLLGVASVLVLPLIRLDAKRLFGVGLGLVLLGVLLLEMRFDFAWLLWFGFTPVGFHSLDYVPLLPWFGVFLLGVAFSKVKQFSFDSPMIAKPFCFVGRHSLLIYLLHVPFLVAVLLLLGKGVYIFG